MSSDGRKRKASSAQADAEYGKERRLSEQYPKWRDHHGYTVLQLANQQTVMFVGDATMQVLNGAVRVSGKLITAGSPPLAVSTGGRFSLAIGITAEPPVAQVPLAAAPIVELSLTSRAPAAGRAAGGGGGGEAAAWPSFSLHRATDPGAPSPAATSQDWEQAVDVMVRHAAGGGALVAAVAGAKGMGKSSFCRLLANRLLDQHPQVAYLDTDCGQPEFTAPGLVSLHMLDGPVLGPPHAHARAPFASYYVGDVSPQSDPDLYITAVQSLYGQYYNHAQRCAAHHHHHHDQGGGGGGGWPPLLVNTHGWVKGLGFDLLAQLIRAVSPTHVVQVHGASGKKDLPTGPFWVEPHQQVAAPPCALLSVRSLASPNHHGNNQGGAASSSGSLAAAASQQQQQQQWLLSRMLRPVESRALAWQAWAKRVVGLDPAGGTYESDDAWQTAGLLAAADPWTISLDDVHVQLLAGAVAPQHVGRVLNGAVVGLLATSAAAAAADVGCGDDGSAAPHPVQYHHHHNAYPRGAVTYAGASLAPPPLLPCVGLGLVRAVDMSTRTLYVLTDVDEEALQHVDVLAVGQLELPGALLVGGEVASPYQQLFSLAAEATGAGAIKGRKNLSRGSLLDAAA